MTQFCCNCRLSLNENSTSIDSPNTNVERLANNNEALTDSAVQIFSENLAQAQMSLERLKETIRVLVAERDRLEKVVRTYRRIVNPVRRLPEVVLREVFRACTDDGTQVMEILNKNQPVGDSLHPRKTPWTLGQVCSRWREVALSHSSLWSFIAIQIPKHGSLASVLLDKMMSQLVFQLRRSGTSPLTLSLRSRHSVTRKDAFLIALSTHSDRWDTLHVDSTCLPTLSFLVKGAFPNLRRLHMDVPGSRLAKIDAFQIAPKLCDISIGGPTTGLHALPIPWAQITHFRSYSYGDSETVNDYSFHQNLVNVRKLYDYRLFAAGSTQASRNPIVLPFLQTLVVGQPHHEASGPSFISNISGPIALRELRLSNFSASKYIPQTFLNSVSSTLHFLYLGCVTMSFARVIEFLEALPNLRELYVNANFKYLVRALALHESSGSRLQLVPRLRCIGLIATSLSVCDDAALLEMLDKRFSSIPSEASQLQKLWINHHISLENETLKQLEVLASQGLEVDVCAPLEWLSFFPGF